MSKKSKFHLVISKKEDLGSEVAETPRDVPIFPLAEGSNTLGRAEGGVDVDLEPFDLEARVSRNHALVTVDGERVSVEDLGSMNGTIVRSTTDPKLAESTLEPGQQVELHPGDEIIIGKIFLQLQGN